MATSTTSDTKGVASTYSATKIISSGKDVIGLLRDIFLFILIVMLLFLPERLNKTLVKAGFTEGNIGGFKWKADTTIAQYDLALKESQAAITDLKSQLDSTSKVLAEAQAKTSDPELKQKLEKVEEENKIVKASSSKTQDNTRRTISTNVALVETAQVAINSGDQWGVVFSGDNDLKPALYEIGIAKRKYDIPNATIYLRQGSYRSVAVVDSYEEAKEVLRKARRKRSDAYIVPMTTWCKNANEKDGYFVCAQ